MDLFKTAFCSPLAGGGHNKVFVFVVVVVVREEMRRRELITGKATPASRLPRVKELLDEGVEENEDEISDGDEEEEILATTSL